MQPILNAATGGYSQPSIASASYAPAVSAAPATNWMLYLGLAALGGVAYMIVKRARKKAPAVGS